MLFSVDKRNRVYPKLILHTSFLTAKFVLHKSINKLKKISFFIIFIFSFIGAKTTYAQLPVENYFKIDNDYVVIDATIYEFDNDAIHKIKLYNSKAKKYLKSLDPIKDSIKTMEAYHYIINANLDLKHYDEALVYLYKIFDYPSFKTSKGAINVYWSIFRIYSYSENYVGQLELIKPLENLGKKYRFFKDTQPLNLKKGKGDVLFSAGYYKEASTFYTTHLIKDSLAFDPLRYAVVVNDLASIYEELFIADSVEKYREMAFKTLKSNRPSSFEETYKAHIKDYIKLQDIKYKKQYSINNLEFAKAFLQNASKNYPGETHTSIFANYFIAIYYNNTKEYQKALSYIEGALHLGYKKTAIRKLNNLYTLKSRILDKLGKEDLASSVLDEFKKIEAQKLAENRRYDLIKYEVNQIKTEKQKAEEKAKFNEIESKNTTGILIFVSCILLIMMIAFIITKQKNKKIKFAQNEVKQELKEKEFLLKELNHRVKNNLSLILSLVRFQYDEIDQNIYKEKFISLENRIRTIATAHDQLIYNKNNLQDENHNLKNYLFKIANALIDLSHKKVKLNIDIQDIELNIDTLLPIGIMINELISNSLKHTNSLGSLKINIIISFSNDIITMNYKDSGTEFKAIENKSSLGISIIESMVNQLKGTINRIKSEYFITLKLKNVRR